MTFLNHYRHSREKLWIYTFALILNIASNLELKNIAKREQGTIATQSVDYKQCYANRSVNGQLGLDVKPSNDTSLCLQCSVALQKDNSTPWWQLDLKFIYVVHYIIIYGRNDGTANTHQSTNTSVIISNNTIVNPDTMVRIPYNETFVNKTTRVTFSSPVQFRYLVIRKDVGNVLTLCEVDIRGPEICHCKEYNKPCDETNSTCGNLPCQPGWTGSDCKTVCPNGTFDDNCTSRCHCLDNIPCDNSDATCSHRCAPGWLELNCSTACPYGMFGDNCTSQCHCLDNMTCNNENGICSNGQCAPGWMGKNCSTVCPNGTYGNNCSGQCHCVDDFPCNQINGTCLDKTCALGWMELNCSKVCPHGTFGSNCSGQCHCLDNMTCDKGNGTCSNGRCAPGWLELNCSTDIDECDSNPCHNGTCINGINMYTCACSHGYTGRNCQTAKSHHVNYSSKIIGTFIGITAAICLVIVFIVAAGLIIRKRNLQTNTDIKEGKKSNIKHEQKQEPILARTATKEYNNICNTSSVVMGNQVEMMGNNELDTAYYSICCNNNTGVKICKLWDYIRNNMENNEDHFNTEFENLPKGLVFGHDVAKHINNTGKNRYREMHAYDHSRVVLQQDGENETDYINASYIHGFDKAKKYIASQGPIKQTINEFWRMIWQENSDTVVMLTDLIEFGVQKCVQYWPDKDGGECCFGNFNVKLLHINTSLDFNIRHLLVQKLNEKPREIVQYHFRSWPDKDVPDSTWCLVNFWRNVECDVVSEAGPIIVHCSAGVGRTGTFIALDILVNQARSQGYVKPLEVVENLRKQRVNMVQTKAQYIYLHEALADALLFGTHFVWKNQFESVYEFMLQREAGSSKTRLEIQYNLIVKSLKPSLESEAMETDYANVGIDAAQRFTYHPQMMQYGLQCVQGFEATFLSNYMNKNVYVIALSPTEDNLEQFWQLVIKHNIKTIIMVTESSSTNNKVACVLGEDRTNTTERSFVSLIEEHQSTFFAEKTFSISENTSKTNENTTIVKQFEFQAWKASNKTPDDTQSMLELLEAVDGWQTPVTDAKPILIHCRTDSQRSGLVCVIMNELHRSKHDGGHINIVESVKMMKQVNIDVISNFEQYRYCYDVIMDHITSDS